MCLGVSVPFFRNTLPKNTLITSSFLAAALYLQLKHLVINQDLRISLILGCFQLLSPQLITQSVLFVINPQMHELTLYTINFHSISSIQVHEVINFASHNSPIFCHLKNIFLT